MDKRLFVVQNPEESSLVAYQLQIETIPNKFYQFLIQQQQLLQQLHASNNNTTISNSSNQHTLKMSDSEKMSEQSQNEILSTDVDMISIGESPSGTTTSEEVGSSKEEIESESSSEKSKTENAPEGKSTSVLQTTITTGETEQEVPSTKQDKQVSEKIDEPVPLALQDSVSKSPSDAANSSPKEKEIEPSSTTKEGQPEEPSVSETQPSPVQDREEGQTDEQPSELQQEAEGGTNSLTGGTVQQQASNEAESTKDKEEQRTDDDVSLLNEQKESSPVVAPMKDLICDDISRENESPPQERAAIIPSNGGGGGEKNVELNETIKSASPGSPPSLPTEDEQSKFHREGSDSMMEVDESVEKGMSETSDTASQQNGESTEEREIEKEEQTQRESAERDNSDDDRNLSPVSTADEHSVTHTLTTTATTTASHDPPMMSQSVTATTPSISQSSILKGRSPAVVGGATSQATPQAMILESHTSTTTQATSEGGTPAATIITHPSFSVSASSPQVAAILSAISPHTQQQQQLLAASSTKTSLKAQSNVVPVIAAHVPVLKTATKVSPLNVYKEQSRIALMGAEKLKVGEVEMLQPSSELLAQQEKIEVKSREEIIGQRAPPQVAVIPPIIDLTKVQESRGGGDRNGGKGRVSEGSGAGGGGAVFIEKQANTALMMQRKEDGKPHSDSDIKVSPHPVARRIWMSSCRPLDPASLERIGVDSKGNVYWYDGGKNMFLSPPSSDPAYKPSESELQLACKSMVQWTAKLKELRNSNTEEDIKLAQCIKDQFLNRVRVATQRKPRDISVLQKLQAVHNVRTHMGGAATLSQPTQTAVVSQATAGSTGAGDATQGTQQQQLVQGAFPQGSILVVPHHGHPGFHAVLPVFANTAVIMPQSHATTSSHVTSSQQQPTVVVPPQTGSAESQVSMATMSEASRLASHMSVASTASVIQSSATPTTKEGAEMSKEKPKEQQASGSQSAATGNAPAIALPPGVLPQALANTMFSSPAALKYDYRQALALAGYSFPTIMTMKVGDAVQLGSVDFESKSIEITGEVPIKKIDVSEVESEDVEMSVDEDKKMTETDHEKKVPETHNKVSKVPIGGKESEATSFQGRSSTEVMSAKLLLSLTDGAHHIATTKDATKPDVEAGFLSPPSALKPMDESSPASSAPHTPSGGRKRKQKPIASAKPGDQSFTDTPAESASTPDKPSAKGAKAKRGRKPKQTEEEGTPVTKSPPKKRGKKQEKPTAAQSKTNSNNFTPEELLQLLDIPPDDSSVTPSKAVSKTKPKSKEISDERPLPLASKASANMEQLKASRTKKPMKEYVIETDSDSDSSSSGSSSSRFSPNSGSSSDSSSDSSSENEKQSETEREVVKKPPQKKAPVRSRRGGGGLRGRGRGGRGRGRGARRGQSSRGRGAGGGVRRKSSHSSSSGGEEESSSSEEEEENDSLAPPKKKVPRSSQRGGRGRGGRRRGRGSGGGRRQLGHIVRIPTSLLTSKPTSGRKRKATSEKEQSETEARKATDFAPDVPVDLATLYATKGGVDLGTLTELAKSVGVSDFEVPSASRSKRTCVRVRQEITRLQEILKDGSAEVKPAVASKPRGRGRGRGGGGGVSRSVAVEDAEPQESSSRISAAAPAVKKYRRPAYSQFTHKRRKRKKKLPEEEALWQPASKPGVSLKPIYIFSTDLANRAAEAVIINKYDNIVQFHQSQPKGPGFLRLPQGEKPPQNYSAGSGRTTSASGEGRKKSESERDKDAPTSVGRGPKRRSARLSEGGSGGTTSKRRSGLRGRSSEDETGTGGGEGYDSHSAKSPPPFLRSSRRLRKRRNTSSSLASPPPVHSPAPNGEHTLKSPISSPPSGSLRSRSSRSSRSGPAPQTRSSRTAKQRRSSQESPPPKSPVGTLTGTTGTASTESTTEEDGDQRMEDDVMMTTSQKDEEGENPYKDFEESDHQPKKVRLDESQQSRSSPGLQSPEQQLSVTNQDGGDEVNYTICHGTPANKSPGIDVSSPRNWVQHQQQLHQQHRVAAGTAQMGLVQHLQQQPPRAAESPHSASSPSVFSHPLSVQGSRGVVAVPQGEDPSRSSGGQYPGSRGGAGVNIGGDPHYQLHQQQQGGSTEQQQSHRDPSSWSAMNIASQFPGVPAGYPPVYNPGLHAAMSYPAHAGQAVPGANYPYPMPYPWGHHHPHSSQLVSHGDHMTQHQQRQLQKAHELSAHQSPHTPAEVYQQHAARSAESLAQLGHTGAGGVESPSNLVLRQQQQQQATSQQSGSSSTSAQKPPGMEKLPLTSPQGPVGLPPPPSLHQFSSPTVAVAAAAAAGSASHSLSHQMQHNPYSRTPHAALTSEHLPPGAHTHPAFHYGFDAGAHSLSQMQMWQQSQMQAQPMRQIAGMHPSHLSPHMAAHHGLWYPSHMPPILPGGEVPGIPKKTNKGSKSNGGDKLSSNQNASNNNNNVHVPPTHAIFLSKYQEQTFPNFSAKHTAALSPTNAAFSIENLTTSHAKDDSRMSSVLAEQITRGPPTAVYPHTHVLSQGTPTNHTHQGQRSFEEHLSTSAILERTRQSNEMNSFPN